MFAIESIDGSAARIRNVAVAGVEQILQVGGDHLTLCWCWLCFIRWRHHPVLHLILDRIPDLDVLKNGGFREVAFQGKVAFLRAVTVAVVAIVLKEGEDVCFPSGSTTHY